MESLPRPRGVAAPKNPGGEQRSFALPLDLRPLPHLHLGQAFSSACVDTAATATATAPTAASAMRRNFVEQVRHDIGPAVIPYFAAAAAVGLAAADTAAAAATVAGGCTLPARREWSAPAWALHRATVATAAATSTVGGGSDTLSACGA